VTGGGERDLEVLRYPVKRAMWRQPSFVPIGERAVERFIKRSKVLLGSEDKYERSKIQRNTQDVRKFKEKEGSQCTHPGGRPGRKKLKPGTKNSAKSGEG